MWRHLNVELLLPLQKGQGRVMSTEYYVMIVGECVTAFLAMIGNGIVLLLIAKDRALQTVTNYFVASLAMADFLVGAVGIPCALVSYNRLPRHSFYGCLIVNCVIVILTQISIFGLLVVAIERCVAIKSPFAYSRYWTGKVASVIISVSWVAAILVGLVPLFGWNLGPSSEPECDFTSVIGMDYMVYFNFMGCVLPALFVILGIYIYIYTVVRRTQRQVASLQVGVETTSKSRLLKDIRAAKWFAVVIALFAVCWLPIHIMNSMTLFGGPFSSAALVTGIILSHTNSAVNPLLYALGNKQFQRSGLKVICRKQTPNDQPSSSFSVAVIPHHVHERRGS